MTNEVVKAPVKRVRKSRAKVVAPVEVTSGPVLMIASPEAFKAADAAAFEERVAPVLSWEEVDAEPLDMDQSWGLDEISALDPIDENFVLDEPLIEAPALNVDVEPTEVELDHIENVIALSEMIAELHGDEADEASADEEPEQDDVSGKITSFADLLTGVSDEAVVTMSTAIGEAMLARVRYEDESDPENDNIHRTLRKVALGLGGGHAARVMFACAVDPSFINREVNAGSRYNVYALDKVVDLVGGLAGGFVQNKINKAVLASLFACRKAGIAFTGDVARAAASDKIRVDAALKGVLVRHTVSAGTAPTQASSTMNALATMGIVTVMGSRKAPLYILNDNAQARYLEERFAA